MAALRRAGSPPPALSRWAWAADIALAAVLGAAALRYALSANDAIVFFPKRSGALPLPPAPQPGGGHPWHAIFAVLPAVPLAVRRRYPLAAFCAVVLFTLLYHGNGDTAPFAFIACLIAAYSAAMYSPYRTATIVAIAIGTVLIAAEHDTAVPNLSATYVPILVLLGIGLAANTVHTWKQRVAALQAEQEDTTQRAVVRERARIAGELHDVVTHNVAVMVVQAGAARKVIDASPDQAREALLAVESGGRAALAELRHVMGLLTMSGDGSESADLAPQPGLDQLATLVARVRETGVPVEVTVTGAPAPLTAGVDLTAYRVVQEALTNTLKHAAGSSVRIVVDYAPDAVRVDVADSGGAATGVSGNGRGLAGLGERLAVYGGTLQAGVLPSGGFRIRATIPLEPA